MSGRKGINRVRDARLIRGKRLKNRLTGGLRRQFTAFMLVICMLLSPICEYGSVSYVMAEEAAGEIIAQSEEQTPQADTGGASETMPAAQPETPAPQPETPAPQPETPAPQPETSAPQPETQAPQSETPAPQTETAALQTETAAPQDTEAGSETQQGMEAAQSESETAAPSTEQASESEVKAASFVYDCSLMTVEMSADQDPVVWPQLSYGGNTVSVRAAEGSAVGLDQIEARITAKAEGHLYAVGKKGSIRSDLGWALPGDTFSISLEGCRGLRLYIPEISQTVRVEKKYLTADFTGVLPENARIDLTRLKEEEVRALLRPEHADALAAEQNVFLLARQITVNDDWQPDGNVTVSFLHDKIAQAIREEKTLGVFRINEDGTQTKVKSWTDSTTLYFDADRFAVYVVRILGDLNYSTTYLNIHAHSKNTWDKLLYEDASFEIPAQEAQELSLVEAYSLRPETEDVTAKVSAAALPEHEENESFEIWVRKDGAYSCLGQIEESGKAVSFTAGSAQAFALVKRTPAQAEQTYQTIASDDNSIIISGMLPEGATVQAQELEAAAAEGSLNAVSVELLDKDGNAIQPQEALDVTVVNDSIEEEMRLGKTITVYHDQEGSLEAITPQSVSQDSVTVTEEQLSDLVVAAEEEYTDRPLVVNDKVTLSGSLPVNLTATVTDVDEGEDALFAADITLSNYDVENVQPQENWSPVTLSITDDAFARTVAEGKALKVFHYTDDGREEEITDFTLEGSTVSFQATGFSVYVVRQVSLETTIDLEGQTYKITVTYDDDAHFPQDARIEAEEVTPEDERYLTYLQETAQALGVELSSMTYSRLLDISIVDADGTRYQPDKNVAVTVELLEDGAQSVNDLRVVHFSEEKDPEELAASTDGSKVSFETDGFSLFSLSDYSLAERVYDAVFGGRKLYEDDSIILRGQMPLLGSVEAEPVSVEIDGVEALVAYDIKIYANPIYKALGITWQPSGEALQVTVKSEGLAGIDGSVNIFHMDSAQSEAELVSEAAVTDASVTFDADAFSIYAVDTAPRKTFLFYNDKDKSSPYTFKLDNSSETTNKQILKDGESLVMPQLPEREGLTFIGWFNCETDEKQAFGEPVSVTANETIDLYARFGHVAYVTFHAAKDSGIWPVGYTREAELVNGEATVTISDITTTPINDTQVFLGWTQSMTDAEDPTNTDFIQTDTITITDDVKLYPVFAEANWLRFSGGENGNGATYKAPQYQLTNNTDSRLDVITRTGYTFQGWYAEQDAEFNGTGTQVTDANGNVLPNLSITGATSDASGNLSLSDDITLYAKWTPNSNTRYTVVYWLQRISDEPGLADNAKTYSYYKADTSRTAPTGSVVSLRVGDKVSSQVGGSGTEYVFNTVNSTPNAGITVKADGSTVLNVYFDLAEVTLTFQVQRSGRWTTIHTVTGLYGQSVAQEFNEEPLKTYTDQGYIWEDYYGEVYTEVLSTIELFPAKNVTFRGSTRGRDRVIYYYVESLDQTSGVSDTRRIFTINGTNLYFDLYKTVRHNFNFLTYNEEYHPIDGFEMNRSYAEPYFGEPGRSAINNTMITNPDRAPIGGRTTQRTTTANVNYLYYLRESNPLTFRNGYNNAEIGSQIYKYQAPLADPGTPAVSYAPMQDAGYYFTGWFADQACSTRVFFSQEEADEKKAETLDDNGDYHYVVISEMPSQPLTLFAGWAQQRFPVTINPDGGVLTDTESTYFNSAYGERILEYTDVTRNYVEREEGDTHPDSDIYYYHYDTRELNSATGNTTRKAYYYPKSEGVKPQTRLDHDGQPVEYIYKPGSYTLVGWYRVVNGKLDLYDFSTKVTEATDLQAVWRKSGIWYVKYDAGNAYQGRGTGTIRDEDGATQEIVQLNTEYADGAMVVLDKVAEPAAGSEWQFVGWHIKGDDTDAIYYPNEGMVYRSAFADSNNVLTLEAVYEKIQKTSITYDANGGNGTLTSGGFVVVDNDKTELTLTDNTAENIEINSEVILSTGDGFTRDGYRLIGWSTYAGRTEDDFDPANNTSTDFLNDGTTHYVVDDPNGNVLYAVWERTYAITYRPNGGSGALDGLTANGDGSYSQKPILKGADAQITDQQYVRPGYRFTGWNTEADGSGIPYEANQQISDINADLVLHAQWEKLLHIIYDVNGGSGTLTNPNGLVSNGMGQYNTGDIYTKDVTTAEISNGNSITRSGYLLAGWNTKADGSGTHYDLSEDIVLSEDLTLYAEWVPLHSLTYNANGGTGTLTSGGSYSYDDTTVTLQGANAYANIPRGAVVTLSGGEGFVRTGYELIGWNSSKAAADAGTVEYGLNGSEMTLEGDTTLYAVWRKLLSVTYDVNGGTGMPAKADSHDLYQISSGVCSTGDVYSSGTNVTVAAAGTMEKEGYVLLGWSTDSTRTAEDFDTSTQTDYALGGTLSNLTEDTTLYAVWQKKAHILYDLNGGSGTLTDPSGLITIGSGQFSTGDIYTVGTDAVLSNGTGISYTGYTLTGWNTKADGTGTEYALRATLTNLPGDVTLYAQWSGTLYLKLVNETGEALSGINVALPAEGMSTATPLSNITLTAGEEKLITITADKSVMDRIVAGTATAAEKQFTVSGTNSLGASYTLIVESEIGDAGVTGRDSAEYEEDYSVTDSLSPSATATVTFTAERQRTLIFDVNGGDPIDNVTFDMSETEYTLPSTIRAGYTFQGWAVTDGGTKVYDAGETVSLSDLFPTGTYEKTLYAIWEPLSAPAEGTVRVMKYVPVGGDQNKEFTFRLSFSGTARTSNYARPEVDFSSKFGSQNIILRSGQYIEITTEVSEGGSGGCSGGSGNHAGVEISIQKYNPDGSVDESSQIGNLYRWESENNTTYTFADCLLTVAEDGENNYSTGITLSSDSRGITSNSANRRISYTFAGNGNYTVAQGTATFTNTFHSPTTDITVVKAARTEENDPLKASENFTFNATINGSAYKTFTVSNLSGSNSYVLKDVPVGAELTITETGAEDFDTAVAVTAGSVTGGSASNENKTYSFTVGSNVATITFANTRKTASVEINKTVENDLLTPEQKNALSFTVQMTLTTQGGVPVGNHVVKDSSGTVVGTTDANGQLTFTVSQQSGKTLKLPVGSKLILAELNAGEYELSAQAAGLTGDLSSGYLLDRDGGTVALTNTVQTTTFTLRKAIANGTAADAERTFSFTSTLRSGNSVMTGYNANGFVQGVKTITITGAGSETVTVPIGVTVEITENLEEDDANRYSVSASGASGGSYSADTRTYSFGTTAEASTVTFTNTRNTVTVKVRKTLDDVTVTGAQNFSFQTVLSEDGNEIGNYILSGIPNIVTNSSGTAQFSLNVSHGDTVEQLLTIPYGADVSIQEAEAADYVTTGSVSDNTGASYTEDSRTAAFTKLTSEGTAAYTNTRKTQTVYVNKTTVDPLNQSRSFSFEAVLKNTDGIAVSGVNTGSAGTTGQDGKVSFTLADSQSQALTLPIGARLEVTELAADLYETTAETKQSGTITGSLSGKTYSFTVPAEGTDDQRTVIFTNTQPYAALTVTKELEDRLTGADSQSFSFKLQVRNGSADGELISLPQNWTVDGNTTTLTTGGTTGEFTITASDNTSGTQTLYLPVGSYVSIEETEDTRYQTTVIAGGIETAASSVDIAPVTADASYTFKNVRKTVPVTIMKVNEAGVALNGATFKLSSGNVASGTVATNQSSTVFVGDLFYDSSIVLTETQYPSNYEKPTDSTATISVAPDGTITSQEASVSGPDVGGRYTIKIENTRNVRKVRVTKTLDDLLSDGAASFEFSAVIREENGMPIEGYPIDGSNATDQNGSYTFTVSVSDGQTAEKELQIPQGSSISVKELLTDEQRSVYDTTVGGIRSDEQTLTGVKEDTSISFVNTRKTSRVYVTKRLSDIFAVEAGTFAFEATLQKSDGTAISSYDTAAGRLVSSSGTTVTSTEGKVHFELSAADGQTSETYLIVPVGSKLEVKETPTTEQAEAYSTTVKYNNEPAADAIQTVINSVLPDINSMVLFTNTRKTVTITLTKEVIGTSTDAYPFTAEVLYNNQLADYNRENFTAGVRSFLLEHESSIDLIIPKGSTLKITEDMLNGSQIDSIVTSPVVEDLDTEENILKFVASEDTTITWKNLALPAPTGFDMRTAPFIIMLIVGMLFLLLGLLNRRRREFE